MASSSPLPLLLLCLVATGAAASGAHGLLPGHGGPTVCPPPGLDTAKDFDLNAFISAPWYSQKQVPVPFQPSPLFCVLARYVPRRTLFGPAVTVVNYASQGAVNGPPVCTSCPGPTNVANLSAIAAPVPPSPTAASKLIVAPSGLISVLPPSLLLNITGVNYKVVAVGPSSNATLKYRWAIIISGRNTPSLPASKGLCSPAEGEGFWLFHREPQAPLLDVLEMIAAAVKLGISPERLIKVTQAGCNYAGAFF